MKVGEGKKEKKWAMGRQKRLFVRATTTWELLCRAFAEAVHVTLPVSMVIWL
jgi:hypothetical protein